MISVVNRKRRAGSHRGSAVGVIALACSVALFLVIFSSGIETVSATNTASKVYVLAETCCKGCSYSSPDGCCCAARDKVPATISTKVTSTFTKSRTTTSTVTQTLTTTVMQGPAGGTRNLVRREEETVEKDNIVPPEAVSEEEQVEDEAPIEQPDDELTTNQDQTPKQLLDLFERAHARHACPVCPKLAKFVKPSKNNVKKQVYCCPARKTVTKTRTVSLTLTRLVKTETVTKSATRTVYMTATTTKTTTCQPTATTVNVPLVMIDNTANLQTTPDTTMGQMVFWMTGRKEAFVIKSPNSLSYEILNVSFVVVNGFSTFPQDGMITLALYDVDASGIPTGPALSTYNISIVATPVGAVYRTWELGGQGNGWMLPPGTPRALVLENGWYASQIAFGYTVDRVDPVTVNCIGWLGYRFKPDTGVDWEEDTSNGGKMAVRVIGQPFAST